MRAVKRVRYVGEFSISFQLTSSLTLEISNGLPVESARREDVGCCRFHSWMSTPPAAGVPPGLPLRPRAGLPPRAAASACAPACARARAARLSEQDAARCAFSPPPAWATPSLAAGAARRQRSEQPAAKGLSAVDRSAAPPRRAGAAVVLLQPDGGAAARDRLAPERRAVQVDSPVGITSASHAAWAPTSTFCRWIARSRSARCTAIGPLRRQPARSPSPRRTRARRGRSAISPRAEVGLQRAHARHSCASLACRALAMSIPAGRFDPLPPSRQSARRTGARRQRHRRQMGRGSAAAAGGAAAAAPTWTVQRSVAGRASSSAAPPRRRGGAGAASGHPPRRAPRGVGAHRRRRRRRRRR